MSSRQSLFYSAALLTGDVSAFRTAFGNKGLITPPDDMPIMKSTLEKNDETSLNNDFQNCSDDEKCDDTLLESMEGKEIVSLESQVSEIMGRFDYKEEDPISKQDYYGSTILHTIAISHDYKKRGPGGKEDMFEVILEKDDENIQKGLPSIISLQASDKDTVLHIIALFGLSVRMVKMILKTNSENMEKGFPSIIDVRGRDGKTALHYAAERGEVKIVELLLTYGADASIRNDEGKTPYELAYAKQLAEEEYAKHQKVVLPTLAQRKEIVRMLNDLEVPGIMKRFGYSVNAPIDTIDSNGKTVLHKIVKRWDGKREMSDLLRVILEKDSENKTKEISSIINVKEKKGLTALHYAAMKRDTGLVKWLLHYGADKTVQNNNGKTPWEMAKVSRRFVDHLMIGSNTRKEKTKTLKKLLNP